MDKKIVNLLASSSTEEGIIKLISEYYYSSNIKLNSINENEYEVFNKKGKIEGVRVIKKKKRFRFESILVDPDKI